MNQRRNFVKLAATIATMGIGLPALADTYPTRPVQWIVPYPAGGPVDTIARHAASLLAPKLGQPIIVTNKPGASGTIGTADVARATPDGYTFGLATTDSLVTAEFLQKSLSYDAKQDFSLIGKLAYSQQLLVVPSNSGMRDLKDFVAAAKAKPGAIPFATWGPGSIPHLYMKSLENAAQIKLLDVPYKGLAPALHDLIGGQIDIALLPPGAALPHYKKGAVSVLSISGGGQLTDFPGVATIQEQGYSAPMFDYTYWAGLIAPKGLPVEILNRWKVLIQEVQAMPEFSATLVPMGMLPAGRIGDQFTDDVKQEFKVIGELVHQLGIEPQ